MASGYRHMPSHAPGCEKNARVRTPARARANTNAHMQLCACFSSIEFGEAPCACECVLGVDHHSRVPGASPASLEPEASKPRTKSTCFSILPAPHLQLGKVRGLGSVLSQSLRPARPEILDTSRITTVDDISPALP